MKTITVYLLDYLFVLLCLLIEDVHFDLYRVTFS